MKCDVMLSNEVRATIITDWFCWILSSTLCLLLIKQISKYQSHGLPLVASCCYSRCYNLHLKKKKKKKNGGFVLSWSIENNAYFSLRLGSEFCWQALLFISNLIQRRNDPLFLSLYYTVDSPHGGILRCHPPTHHIYTHLHISNRDQHISTAEQSSTILN